jgi:hypothetical protein
MPPLPISEELHLSLEGNRISGIFNLSGQRGVRKGEKPDVIYIYTLFIILEYTT